ncbi:ctr copper transporter [Thozetella sp. PMI_491]|nr:ctr copper transporter [Thozetella sp. PMI_491]
MLWNWSTIDACFLSSDWHITSKGAFAATCIGAALMVVLLEALRRIGKEYDESILRQFNARLSLIEADAESRGTGAPGRTVVFRASPLQQLIRSIIHAVTFGLAYIVMLLVMYYNGYIIISIIIGAGLGKFLCDWMTRTAVIGASRIGEKKGADVCEEPTVCCG